MGQYEVLKFVESVSKPVSARQISEALDCRYELVSKNLRKLLELQEIKSVEMDRYQARLYLQNSKILRRMLLYFPVHLSFVAGQLVDPHSLLEAK